MGGVSSAMVGLTFSRSGGSTEGRVISKRTVDMVSAVYVPLAIIMVAYAIFMYNSRSTFMRKKQVRGWGRGAKGGVAAGVASAGAFEGRALCAQLRVCSLVRSPAAARSVADRGVG